MKNTDLIAAVGGIEKARGIVAGAPNHAQVSIPCLDGVMYFSKRNDGKWFKWSDGYSQWLEYFGRVDPMDLAIELDDLRTAIAEHDRAVAKPEFKVGDFITYNHGIADDRIYKIVEDHVVHGFVVASSGDREFWTMFVGEFVKATPAEIKAGHRIDRALTSDSDDVSDIAYHVSPNTKVSER